MKASCRSGWCGKAIPASGAARGQTGTEDKTGEAVEAEDEVEHRVKDSVDEVEVARGEEMEMERQQNEPIWDANQDIPQSMNCEDKCFER